MQIGITQYVNLTSHIPFYLRISQIMLGLIAFCFILYIGQEIILPLLYSLVLAILLNPVVNFLTLRKINKLLAISIVVTTTILLFLGITYLASSQIMKFTDALPSMKEKFDLLLNQTTDFLSRNLHLRTEQINEWIDKGKQELSGGSSAMIGKTLGTVTSMVFVLTLIPVYVFLFLYYKPLLLEFIAKLFTNKNKESAKDVLVQTKLLIQSYLSGLILEVLIVGALNSVGLLILGIDYAILIGMVGGLFNLIPYIGGIVGTAVPMLLALATQSPLSALLVLIIYLVIQFIDNNYIMPVMVASRVKINALFSVIVVIVGGTMWGIGGMFLALPLTAIVKVIFDRIETMEPWGYLLGDTMPKRQTLFFSRKKKAESKSTIKTAS